VPAEDTAFQRDLLAMPTSSKEVSVIVVSYNTRELTIACLDSLRAQTDGLDYEVIVVDNASEDGSADAIAARQGDVRLLALDTNLGFARANNLAAEKSHGEFLLLLNPDTVVLDGAVQRLVAFARAHPEAGIFGGRTFFPDGSLNPASCWGRPTPWSTFCLASGLTHLFRRTRLFDPESLGRWERDTVREVDIVTGCFFLVTRRLWDALGGFDDAFFMYGEEADLCLRARARGVRCLICPEARIIHYGGASERVVEDKMVRLLGGKARVFQKHWSPMAAAFGARMLDAWAFWRMTAFGLLATARPERSGAFETWRRIWRRRQEWRLRSAPDASAAWSRSR
jgi:N-acetylglucosaminyl-diphospho-decaprenol L-rhamnosyltransferase